jgi:hypothetical protein
VEGAGGFGWRAGIGKVFFFEKKNQKTSVRLGLGLAIGTAETDGSLFASFSSEKEDFS